MKPGSALLGLLVGVLAAVGAGQGVLRAQGLPPGASPALSPYGIVLRHEPIFGVGPHTTWRGGWGVEFQVERQGGETVIPVEVLYGITETLTVTGVLPFRTSTPDGGLGDVGLRAKWRFATNVARGRADALALIGGVVIPRHAVGGTPRGGAGLMLGLAAGRESRRWYYFAGARGTLRVSRDAYDPGDRLALNLAWGVRPWLSAFDAPDLVLLLETNFRGEGRSALAGAVERRTGGRFASAGPAMLLSLRNIMLKLGLDIPIWDRLNDPTRSSRTTVVGALEVHW